MTEPRLLSPELCDQLRAIRLSEPVYIPNPGNAGDSFIAHSTYQLLGDLKVEYELGSQSGEYPGRTLICGGGGNLVQPYPNMIGFIKRNLNKWKHLIILPHSIRSYSDVLRQFGANTYIHCRELESYEYVKSASGKAGVFLSHDLAFCCDLDKVQEQYRRNAWVNYSEPKIAVRDAKRLMRVLLYRFKNGHHETLNVIRGDVEKADLSVPTDNFDISALFSADDMTPESSLHATYAMLRFIDKFKVVQTNRLHVGIMATLLNKKVVLYDNSYGKIVSVFHYSIKERFLNVSMVNS